MVFCENFAGINTRAIMMCSLLMCRHKNMDYPFNMRVDTKIAQEMYGVKANYITIDHHDKTIDNNWFNTAYHYQRKNGYWRCSISEFWT